MTERQGEPTRYLSFKLDKYAVYLEPRLKKVLEEIMKESEGITFEELTERAYIGPQHLRAVLKDLFDRDYIITNHQMTKLKEKYRIDAQELRRFAP